MTADDLFDRFAAALEGARQAAGPALPAAAALVRTRGGLVVATGAGKSGIAARKFVATLATLGRRALFLDPLAAGHGEAAVLAPDDLLVVVSRSGETDEVVDLALVAPCPVLVVTARPESRLGRAAAGVLPLGPVTDPGRGVPTASFLATVAVLDALALALDAGEPEAPHLPHHPRGALGRGRSVPVARVMHPPPVLPPEASASEVLDLLTGRALGAVVLVAGGRLAGIVTDGDLRRAVGRLGPEVLSARARDLATPDPVVVRHTASLAEALALMEDRPRQIAVLPVVDDGHRVVGLLRLHDVVRAGVG